MLGLISFLLKLLPPETAHSLALLGLRLYQWAWRPHFLAHSASSFHLRIPPKFEMTFSSRLGLAAGFDKQAEVFQALGMLGFGFVEVGTVTPLPQKGNPKPRIWRLPAQALVNHLGFNSVGLQEFKRNIQKNRSKSKVPLFANIGKNKETPREEALQDYKKCMESLEDCVDGFVVNISSPNTPTLRDLQNIHFLEGLSSILPDRKPTWVKLAPDLSPDSFQEILEFVKEDPKISGVVLTNTSRNLAESQGFSQGGLSGRSLFPLSLERVEKAANLFKGRKIVVGVGGISSLADAEQMRERGADLVEVYTSFVFQGPRLVREISSSLK